ncbi:MAG: low molecular weight phosphatase family protein [Promethearchaeota archaeon]
MILKHVLFVCVQNAGRSQMAGAFAQKYGEGRITVSTGGTHPANQVHPEVVKVMQEKGIDISENVPRRISVAELNAADQVVVMGCGAESFCPAPLLIKVIDWDLEDPAGQPLKKVRKIRDEIERRVVHLIDNMTAIETQGTNST